VRVCRQKPKGAELKKYDNKVFRGILVQMNSLRRWPYTFIICVAFLTIIGAIAASVHTGVPMRDPEGFLGPAYIRLPLIALLLFAVGLVPAAIRRCGWRSIPRGMLEIIKYEWTWKRVFYIGTGFFAFYLCYVGYRNLKSVLPIYTDGVLWDTELAQLDKWMFGGVNPAFVMQDVFGVGVSAEILSIFYLAYMPLIPLSIGVVLVLCRNLATGAWFVTAISLNWVMGAISYYAFPAVGPVYYQQQYYQALPETGTTALQATLWDNRLEFLADPVAAEVIHGVAAFASLHCSVTFAIALFAHKTSSNAILRWGAWIFFGATFIATVYFGWHYVVDSIAGVFIGWMCVAIGQRVTKAQPLRNRSTVLDPMEVVSSPDRVTT